MMSKISMDTLKIDLFENASYKNKYIFLKKATKPNEFS